MHRDHDIFVQAIKDKRKVRLTYFSNTDSSFQIRLCAPLYYSPSHIEGDDSDCYYFWNFESGGGKPFFYLAPSLTVDMELTEEAFDLSEFAT